MQMQDLKPRADTEQATLEWLVTALDYARSNGQTKVVGYLEEVADDVVFEVEMVARRMSIIGWGLPIAELVMVEAAYLEARRSSDA